MTLSNGYASNVTRTPPARYPPSYTPEMIAKLETESRASMLLQNLQNAAKNLQLLTQRENLSDEWLQHAMRIGLALDRLARSVPKTTVVAPAAPAPSSHGADK